MTVRAAAMGALVTVAAAVVVPGALPARLQLGVMLSAPLMQLPPPRLHARPWWCPRTWEVLQARARASVGARLGRGRALLRSSCSRAPMAWPPPTTTTWPAPPWVPPAAQPQTPPPRQAAASLAPREAGAARRVMQRVMRQAPAPLRPSRRLGPRLRPLRPQRCRAGPHPLVRSQARAARGRRSARQPRQQQLGGLRGPQQRAQRQCRPRRPRQRLPSPLQRPSPRRHPLRPCSSSAPCARPCSTRPWCCATTCATRTPAPRWTRRRWRRWPSRAATAEARAHRRGTRPLRTAWKPSRSATSSAGHAAARAGRARQQRVRVVRTARQLGTVLRQRPSPRGTTGRRATAARRRARARAAGRAMQRRRAVTRQHLQLHPRWPWLRAHEPHLTPLPELGAGARSRRGGASCRCWVRGGAQQQCSRGCCHTPRAPSCQAAAVARPPCSTCCTVGCRLEWPGCTEAAAASSGAVSHGQSPLGH
mmetsp:Transcript_36017/g.90995  ORF Transcript_36017/g.90995 Transcript_36017/m.90995 type:complete len:478 (+) Transcript_36017:293-1726(+)